MNFVTEKPGTVPTMQAEPLMSVQDLIVEVGSTGQRILDGVSFDIVRGRALGILGETGSGKSMTLRSILGLLPRGLVVAGGKIAYGDLDMLKLSGRATRNVRGKRVGFVPQQPTQALNPVLPVRSQFIRVARARGRAQKARAVTRAIELLERVGLTQYERVLASYPGELSGGMAQRVAIAMALFWDPEIIVADEPTTALDLTVQKDILSLLSRVAVEDGRALVIVTHDLGVVSHYCDDTVVLSKGKVVEQGPIHATLNRPKTEYVRRLIDATRSKPRQIDAEESTDEPIYELRNVSKSFTRRNQRVDAMKSISLSGRAGRTLGVIGESGSGKSTTGMVILGREEPDSGEVIFRLGEADAGDTARSANGGVSVVFQNPHDALNPRMTVGSSVLEPLEIQFSHWTSAERTTAAKEALSLAQLDPEIYWDRYPRSLSGGQQQRVTVARAIATKPSLVVLDEPTASLDASVRAALLDTLESVQKEVGTAYFLISHDIATILRLADDVVVMHDGAIVEHGKARDVLENPSDDYTRTLLAAALEIQDERGVSPERTA